MPKQYEIKMWKIRKRDKYGTLWEKNGQFVDVRKMFTHGGYNPKSAWYVFYGDNHSDLNADYVSSSRIMAEKNAVAWMRSH